MFKEVFPGFESGLPLFLDDYATDLDPESTPIFSVAQRRRGWKDYMKGLLLPRRDLSVWGAGLPSPG